MNLSICFAVLAIILNAAAAPLDEDVSKRFSFEPPPEGFDQNDPRLDPDPNIDNPPQRLLTFNSHDYSPSTDSGNSLLVSDLESKLPSPHLRFKRDTSKSLQLYNRVAVIARIANGIALQAGLMDGSIKIDDVLPELLNFGKMKVSDVVDFKPDPVTKFIDDIKKMPSVLKLKNEVKELEDKTVQWNNLRISYESLPDFNNFPVGSKYFSDLSEYTKSKTFKSASQIQSGFKEMETLLGDIDGFRKKPSSVDPDTDLEPFTNFRSKFIKICKNFENIKTIDQELQAETVFEKSTSEFGQVENFLNIVKTRNSIGGLVVHVDSVSPILKSEFGELKKLSGSSSAVGKEWGRLISVLQSRMTHHNSVRKFTSGFSDGVLDVLRTSNDTSNTWIEKILTEKGDIQSLTKGLRPLTRNMEPVRTVDSLLRSISNTELLRATSDFSLIETGMTALDPSLESYSRVFDEMSKCGTLGSTKLDIKKIEGIINDAKKLPEDLKTLRTSLKPLFDTDLTDFKKSTEAFIKSWGFKDIGNSVSSKQDLPTVVQKLDATTISDLTKILQSLAKKTKKIGALEFSLKIDQVTDGETVMTDFFKDKETQKENNVVKCLQNHKSKSEAAANGIRLIQTLRSQNTKTTGDVENAVSVFSKVAKALPALKSIPSDMKKDVNSHITDLNNMTDALKTSQTIGESVNLLRGAVVLKELESEISDLKRILPIVQKEISNISSPLEKQTVESQWGTLQHEMSSVDGGIKTAVEFDAKLDVPKARIRRAIEFKTLEDYGIALPKLLDITDVTIDAENKVKDLEILIQRTNDPQVKAELEKAKAIFEKFVGLDLQYSKHQATLKETPMAFKRLNDFLVDFINKKNKEEEGDPPSENEDNSGLPWYVWVGGSIAAVLIVGGAVVVVLLVLRKKKNEKQGSESIEKGKEKGTEKGKEKGEGKEKDKGKGEKKGNAEKKKGAVESESAEPSGEDPSKKPSLHV